MAIYRSRQAMVDLSTNTSIHPFFTQVDESSKSKDPPLEQASGISIQHQPNSPTQYGQSNGSKRRRLDSPSRDASTGFEDDDNTANDMISPALALRGNREDAQVNTTEGQEAGNGELPIVAASRALRLDGKGGLGSPAQKPQPISNEVAAPQPTSRLSHRKSKERILCVKIAYGQRDLQRRVQIGQKLNQILSSASPSKSEVARAPQTQGATVVHPFFNRKRPQAGRGTAQTSSGAQSAQSTARNANIKSFTNPHLPLRKTQDTGSRFDHLPTFRGSYCLPGTAEALWPPRAWSRVDGSVLAERLFDRTRLRDDIRARRNKTKAPQIENENDLMEVQRRKLKLIADPLVASHLTAVAPRRIVLTNRELQQEYSNKPDAQHPALCRLWSNLAFSLSPFDEGYHSSVSWCQKYAPRMGSDVLGNEKEVAALRVWLQAQAVDAVASDLSTSKHEHSKHRRKRRKRKEDLDDFIVSDDNIDDAASEDLSAIHTALEGRVTGSRQSNIIVLSGEHGIGKSAAIQAVAKELEFSIFEINAGTRRSGKDLLDKVGDLARNHQVHNNPADPSPSASAVTPEEGQQKSVKNFFGSNTRTGIAPKQKKGPGSNEKQKHSSQKQALILLEEVDILFEEDRLFWETLSSLAEQSRRPIIITCNDERLAQTSNFQPYGILRFCAPPADIVTSYLRLVAAAEGHLLETSAIAKLYTSRGHDLRATIQDLNFWCQMAIGDTKGGMDWMLSVWPRGANVNEAGERLRVISDGTFTMSLLNSIQSQQHREWLDNSRVAPIDALELASRANHEQSSLQDRLSPLIEFDIVASMLSSADMFPANSMCNLPMDTTLPPLSDSARQQYTEGYRLLEVQEHEDSMAIGASYATSIALLVDRYAAPCLHSNNGALPSQDPNYSRPPELFDSSNLSVSRTSMALDYLPYLRTIAAYDLALERLHYDPAKKDGRASKLRTTRAARSALEGGDRKTTRRARWLPLNTDLLEIMDTGGVEWAQVPFAGEYSSPQSSPMEITDMTG